MKKTGQKLVVLLLYFVILLYVTGYRWGAIWDAKAFGMVVAGMVLLSVPQMITGWHRDGLKNWWYQISGIFSWNALAASYITAVMLLLAKLTEGINPELVIKELALALRPILYGLLFYVLFHRDERSKGKKEKETQDVCEEKVQETKEQEAQGRQEKQKKEPLSPEQLCYFFRAKGLTAREAEVAKLLYQGCSNREIAVDLYIAETTVKKHVTHILEKLNIEQRGQIQELVAEVLDLTEKKEP